MTAQSSGSLITVISSIYTS